MKRNLFILSALGLSAAASLLSSCRDYDVMDEGVAKEVAAVKEFNQHFIEHFGEPDPDHTWGTDKKLKPIFEAGTRATTQNVNVNRNQWCARNTDGTYKTTEQGFLHDKFEVPGWPNFDGFYYTGGEQLKNIYNQNEMFANNNAQPAGDITDYEIQYVSTWFRTHKNPISTKLHLTDFFVQNVSCDKDQLWYDGYVEGYTNDLGGLTGPGNNGPNADHVDDVLVAGTNNYRTDYTEHVLAPKMQKKDGHLNSNEGLNYDLDYLHFGDMSTSAAPNNQTELGDGWTHVNNFNAGNSNRNPEEKQQRDRMNREMMFITSSGTENFACRPSQGTVRNWINKWVLVRLDWEEVGADGVSRQRYGYYLGFDFSAETGDTYIQEDGFYSNWIIKITPAYFVEGDHAARVMCEDLGGSFDFDFNDVVFDIAYDANTEENIIAIQAAGGTLPIYVGSSDAKLEAHKLLGQEDSTNPINVIEGSSNNHEIAIYRVKAGGNAATTEEYYKMPIYVKQEGRLVDVNNPIPEKADYEWNDTNKEYNKNLEDKVPRKFVTEVGVKWAKELKPIDKAYNRFHDWVKDKNFKYEDVNNKTLYWYNSPGDYSLIYDYNNQKVISIDGTTVNVIPQWLNIEVVSVETEFANKGFATEIVTVAGYTGPNSIIDQLTTQNKQRVTFAYFFKAEASQEPASQVVPEAIMIPVWINEGKAFYKDTEITENLIREFPYEQSVWQSSFCQNKHASGSVYGNPKTGIDPLGFKTYVSKFAFLKDEIYYDSKWCDYIMLFVKQDLDLDTDKKTTGDVRWYETYSIL